MDAHEWKILGFLSGPLIGLYVLFTKHIIGSSRHPKADNLVYKDVCEERGKNNDIEHHHLKEGIDELKTDVKDGFARVEALITAKK